MDTASSSRAEARGRGRPDWIGLAGWLLAAVLCTAALWLYRDPLPTAHKALAYLLLVLLGSARQGRVVGLLLSVACFVGFNFFLLPPYYTFALRDPLNWWVLVAFLITGAVAAELFHRTQRALAESESRARVLDRLAAVGAESLAVPRAVDAVRAIARAVRAELPVAACRIVMREPPDAEAIGAAAIDGPCEPLDPQLVEIAVRERRIVGVRRDGTLHLALGDALFPAAPEEMAELVVLVVPLRVHNRVVGVLALEDPAGLRLEAERTRFADALVHYAALAVERVRLTAESEHVEALREADRVKDAVLASVSHDLRTPLTTIRALGSELRSSGDERAALIEDEAERLNRMVGSLLDLSRIRGGALPLEPQLFAADDLIGALLQRFVGVPAADRIEVRLPPGELPVGRFDFAQTLRALSNLVENALRHSPPDRPIELEVVEEASELIFRVLDRGEGVAAEDRDRIFEPFVRGRATEARRAGAGLGLAIARSVAEAQGGSVRYRPRPGGGSVFELRLPVGRFQDVP